MLPNELLKVWYTDKSTIKINDYITQLGGDGLMGKVRNKIYMDAILDLYINILRK